MSLKFDGQREGEEVIFMFRRSFFTTISGFWWLVGCLGLGILAMAIWPDAGFAFGVFMALMAVGALVWGYKSMLWYFTVYIVTNERVRIVLQQGMFKQRTTDLGLEKIDAVTMDTSGVMAHLFRYGTILVQTVVGDLTISKAARPKSVYNKLQNAVNEFGGVEKDG